MLEVLTLRYAELAQGLLIAIGLGVIVLGGMLVFVLVPRRSDLLSRSWYLQRLGMASFLFAVNQLWWFLYVPAVKIGVSFLFVLTDTVGELAYGAYIAHIALARSRDAYGHDGRAWWAFVPFVNLFLLFKPSQTPDTAPGSTAAALVGLVLFGMGRAVIGIIENSGDGFGEQVASDPQALEIIRSLKMRAQGIEAALDDLIAAEAAPTRLATTLELTAVTRRASHLRYDFTLDLPQDEVLSADYRRQVHAQMCAGLMQYLTMGATAALHYARPNGSEIEILTLSLAECTT